MHRHFVARLALLAALGACATEVGPSQPELPDWWDTGTDGRVRDIVDQDTEPEDTAPRDTGVAEEVEVDTTPLAGDGAACTDSSECAGGDCLPQVAWPDGYCTKRSCERDSECASESAICTSLNATWLCAAKCDSDDDCREGYWCAPAEQRSERICIPGSEPVALAPDGAPCEVHADCAGGTCFYDPDWPGGYCTTRGCLLTHSCADGDEGIDNRCILSRPRNYCARVCEQVTDCRSDEGYTCVTLQPGVNVCLPDTIRPPTRELDFDDYPFEVTCGLASESGELTVTYTVSEAAKSYIVVPIAKDGARIQPLRVELPDGGTIDLEGDNAFQLAPSLLFGYLNPLVVPPIPAFEEQLQAGEHQLVIATNTSDLCWYLIEDVDDDTTVDLNLYLIGVPDVDASSAPGDPAIAEMFATFDGMLTDAGASLGTVRFIDGTAAQVERYAVIRDDDDLLELVESSERPGETVDDAMSINVYLVRGIAGSLSGVLGVSMGLPGAAGAHGTRSSGVAVTGEYLREEIAGQGPGDIYTGAVVAHEVGHYLGLLHTSEIGGTAFDALDDTPECRTGFPDECPDRRNVMFPYAGSDHDELSDGQVFQIRANPLTKPR